LSPANLPPGDSTVYIRFPPVTSTRPSASSELPLHQMLTGCPVLGSIGGLTRLNERGPVPLDGSHSTATARWRGPSGRSGWLGIEYQSTLPVGSITAWVANVVVPSGVRMSNSPPSGQRPVRSSRPLAASRARWRAARRLARASARRQRGSRW
jgi:hypothetical protein